MAWLFEVFDLLREAMVDMLKGSPLACSHILATSEISCTMKRILWPLGNIPETLYVLRMVDKLAVLSEIETTFVTDFKISADALSKQGKPYFSLGRLFEQAKAAFPAGKEELIRKANESMPGLDLNMIVHGDHYLKMALPAEAAQVLTAKTILAYDWLFQHQKFDYLVRYGGNNLNFWVASIMAEKHGIPRYVLISAGLFERCGLQPSGINEQWDWNGFERLWPQVKDTEAL